MERIKEYCKLHRLKFEKLTLDGFIAFKKESVRAGVEIDLYTGNLASLPIKRVGSRRVYRNFKCYPDGDISDHGKINKH